MRITFEDYRKENIFFLKQIRSSVEAVLELRFEYEHDRYIENLEKEFAEINGSQYVIAVNSGTTALELALKAAGIKKNDEVILPSYTYISTALAISNLDAIPVFVDVKKTTFTIDPKKIENKLTAKTKAVIPVHIHGNPCEMDKIVKIARENNLAIVEDCSHAHGAEYNGKKVGNFGIGCFSCHTTKILSGIGNSGLITVNDRKIYKKIKKMLDVKNDPDLTLSKRSPCKIDVIQAAILRTKLPYLEKIIARKRNIARNYIKTLPRDVQYQKEEKGSRHVYRDFVILAKRRDELKDHLEHAGIETKIRYRTPLHLTQYYKDLHSKKEDLQMTEDVFNKLLWLPVSYIIANKEVLHICNAIKEFRHEHKKKK